MWQLQSKSSSSTSTIVTQLHVVIIHDVIPLRALNIFLVLRVHRLSIFVQSQGRHAVTPRCVSNRLSIWGWATMPEWCVVTGTETTCDVRLSIALQSPARTHDDHTCRWHCDHPRMAHAC